MKKLLFAVAIAATFCFASCCGNQCQVDDNDGADTAQIVMQNILTRHSVREFTDQKISSDTIEMLLRAAMAAPTGMDVRPWRFVVLTDTSRYNEIFGDDNLNMPKYKQAAAVFVLCADTTWSHKHLTEGQVSPNDNWPCDMGACAENLLLAAHAYGLGAVWTGCYPHAERMNPVKKALELPAEVNPFCIIPVGYPKEQTEPKDKWNAENIHYERW